MTLAPPQIESAAARCAAGAGFGPPPLEESPAREGCGLALNAPLTRLQPGVILFGDGCVGLLIEELLAGCPLPRGLADCGIPRAALPRLALAALTVTRLLRNNPRPPTEADALAIYEAAW